MKGFLFSILIFLFIGMPLKGADNMRMETLERQLEVLLPGTSIQKQSSRMYAKEQLQSFFETLEKRKVRRKNTTKALGMIQEELERTFFRKFRDFSEMNQLFKQGVYDQSTASALYVMVLNYFDVPYLINIIASDIRLVIDPLELNEILIIPHSKTLNEAKYRAFQMAYLELLRTVNVSTPEDWNKQPEHIFNTYYLGTTSDFTIKQMAGFLHYRKALNAYADKNWVTCLDELNSAQIMSALPLYGVLERVVWLQLTNEDKDGGLSLHYLWKLWKENPNQVFQSELIDRFNKKIIIDKNITQWKIDSIYASFRQQFGENESAKEQLKATNYLVQARFFAQEGHTLQVMNFMDSLYVLRPNDEEVQKVLAGMLVWSLKSERDFNIGLKRISYYEKKYPFLNKNPVFHDQHLFYSAEKVRSHFDEDEYVSGTIYLQEFEYLLNQMQATQRHTSWVSTVYISASNYYFRENNYAKALELIKTALHLVPEDDYLLHRKNLLERYR